MMIKTPFRLSFENGCARFPFIFEGRPLFAPAPSCIISARSAGDMKFSPRPGALQGPVREAFFRACGIDQDRVYSLVQVHSRDVFVLEDHGGAVLPSPAKFVREGDGMAYVPRNGLSADRESPGVFLAVTVADCLPVFLLDTRRGSCAVLHSGWKGTGIVLKALSAMTERGTMPEEIAAVLGPCIQSCCYRVDEERAAEFEAAFGEASKLVPAGTANPLGPAVRKTGDAWYIALQAANARLLAGAGVRHIAYCEDCTYTNEILGSYRREGPVFYTRMIAMAG